MKILSTTKTNPFLSKIDFKKINFQPGGKGKEFAINLINSIELSTQPNGYCSQNNPIFPTNKQENCNAS